MKTKDLVYDPVLKMDILLWRIFKLLIKNKRCALEKVDLTCSQFDILFAILYFSLNKVEVIQISLSERTGIDPMTTSTILRNLERKRLVARRRSTTNTRTVLVNLTDKGMKLLEEATKQIKSSCEKIYENVDKEELLSQLLKLSEKLNN